MFLFVCSRKLEIHGIVDRARCWGGTVFAQFDSTRNWLLNSILINTFENSPDKWVRAGRGCVHSLSIASAINNVDADVSVGDGAIGDAIADIGKSDRPVDTDVHFGPHNESTVIFSPGKVHWESSGQITYAGTFLCSERGDCVNIKIAGNCHWSGIFTRKHDSYTEGGCVNIVGTSEVNNVMSNAWASTLFSSFC